MSSVSSNPPPLPAAVAVTTTTTSLNTGSSSGSTASLSPTRKSSGGDQYASISDSAPDPTASPDACLITLNECEPRTEANHNQWHPQPEEADAGPSTSDSAATTTTTTTTVKLSGILLTTSVGVILACYTTYEEKTSSKALLSDHYSWLIQVEAAIQCMAIIFMIAGMSLPAAAAYCVSPLWLQKFGHVLCLAGVALLPAPLLHLPVIWCWIPLFLLVAVLCPAMLFVC